MATTAVPLGPLAHSENTSRHASAAAPAKPDFPFYNGEPVRVSGARWLVVLAGVAAGAAADLLVAVPGPVWVSTTVRAALFVGIPLFAYMIAIPGHWRTIFRRVRFVDVLMMVGVAALNLVVTAIAGTVAALLTHTSANGMGASLHGMDLMDRIMTFLSMIPQLLGEEVFTILPLLAILWFAVTKLHLPRTVAVILAWVVTAVLFGLLHLPTYGWNIVQCLVTIGAARLVLSLAFLRTKNIWVSTGAHVLNDWTLFALPLLLA